MSPDQNFASCPVFLNPESQEKLRIYLDMVDSWNRSLNLTGYKNKNSFMKNLVADSFYLADFMNRFDWQDASGVNIWDLGAGAGLPGIPLRILWQKGHYYLVEARQKRALFLSNVLARLKLPETSVFHGRAEDFFKLHKSAECILSRAFMPWQKLLSFCEPYLSPQGVLIIFASEVAPALPGQWRLKDHYQYLAADKSRWFWAIEKV